MSKPFSLIPFQEEAIAEIIGFSENGRRAASYGLTILNRKSRSVCALHRRFDATLAKRGYTRPQINAAWQAVKDMAQLEASAN